MKKIVSLILISITYLSMTAFEKTTILFFGDSITQQGVEKNGYIQQIQEHIAHSSSNLEYNLIGSGISGNKIYDLYLRLEDDVLNKKPNIVVIFIGVNDVWHKVTAHTGTDLNKFEAFYKAIIKKLQSANIKTVLCTPAVIGEKRNGENSLDKELDDYANTIQKIAVDYKCDLIDLRSIFTAYNEKNNTANANYGLLTTDGVHLNFNGNKQVADAIIKQLNIK